MSMFSKTEIDLYKNKSKVLKTLRIDVPLAVKIDELQTVCTSRKGYKVSQNQILTSIVNSYINEIEQLAKDNEEMAVNKVLSIIKDN